ncbi:hypothetical protein [Thalassobacillus sp. CUG 92003]|uniref:hypothetical protein n=1 Tax=Thalassobacillus sp. CUG 92003 TaxID=2736641 RepID=UPI0015E7B601|nr:hypothetical protein [Thalassobacillus sp. CUG 92003]
MAKFVNRLIVVDTTDQARALNAESTDGLYQDDYAISYGKSALGVRYNTLEYRIQDVKRHEEYEEMLTQGQSWYDVRNVFRTS